MFPGTARGCAGSSFKNSGSDADGLKIHWTPGILLPSSFSFMQPITEAFELSLAGRKFTGHSGIVELMDDLGRALSDDLQMRMLGGGNPAAVPGMQDLVRGRLCELLADGDAFDRMMVNYDPPQGNPRFIRALAGLLQREFGWDIGPQNIALSSGGQCAFFFLFNLLAGRFNHGRAK